jgi:hypothetical protein
MRGNAILLADVQQAIKDSWSHLLKSNDRFRIISIPVHPIRVYTEKMLLKKIPGYTAKNSPIEEQATVWLQLSINKKKNIDVKKKEFTGYSDINMSLWKEIDIAGVTEEDLSASGILQLLFHRAVGDKECGHRTAMLNHLPKRTYYVKPIRPIRPIKNSNAGRQHY